MNINGFKKKQNEIIFNTLKGVLIQNGLEGARCVGAVRSKAAKAI